MTESHPHNHSHSHHHANATGKVLIWGVAFTLGFAIVEAIGGWLSGSLALISDAGHMLSDAIALTFAAFAAFLARRPPSQRHSYGLGRAEVIAALINGTTMLVIVTGIAIAAVQRFTHPQPVMGGTVIVIATLGLLVNVVLAYMLSRGEQTLNIRGALLHVLGDLLGSVAAIIAGTVIYFTGWTPIDPILSLFISVLIVFSAWGLLRDSLHVIMEGVPTHIDFNTVGNTMVHINQVVSVHDLHIWTLSSGNIALSAHIVLDHMNHWQSVLKALNDALANDYAIHHTTLQPECYTHVIHPAEKLSTKENELT